MEIYFTQKEAKELIAKHVEKGSTMVSDGHSMYAYILKENEFTHVMVDHAKGEYVKGGFHTKGPIQIRFDCSAYRNGY